MLPSSKWKNVRRKLTTTDKTSTALDGWSLSTNLEPELCIRLLKTPSVQNFSGLKTKLKTSSKEWIEEFLSFGGFEVLFEGLIRLSGRRLSFVDAFLQLECVNCIKEVMNSKPGLHYMIHDKQFSRHLVKGIVHE